MKKILFVCMASGFLVSTTNAQQMPAPVSTLSAAKPGSDSTKSSATAPKKQTVADKTKGNKKLEGLFTLYQDTATGSMQVYIRKDQLGKEFIYQSFSINGPVALFLHQSMHRSTAVFKIEKAYDKLEFSEVNTNFWYDPNNAVSKTSNVDKPEAVFYSDKYSIEDSLGYLVSGDALFLSEKLDPVKPVIAPSPLAAFTFNLGMLNTAKSKYATVRSFPGNTDVVVDLSYDNPVTLAQGGNDITDTRYVRVRMQHSFIEMPKNDFTGRRDDPRVGYFTQQRNNQTSTSPTPYKDMINRWYLQKKDPSAAVSEPVEPLVYWIENTTPLEYRQAIMDAGHKWNEAFEKAGFKNAVVMKIMPDDATWDPADIKYNVIRWVASATPAYGAIGPSFVNPRTGQILGADISVEWASGSATPIFDDLYNSAAASTPVWGTPEWDAAQKAAPEMMFPGLKMENTRNCSIGAELKAQYTAGLTTLEMAGAAPDEIKEMHKQFLYYLIMHEMGHTLGLNHNMKSSQMLSPAEINNTSITHSIGLMGSVMDYPAINVSLDRSKQGDYYTTKAGPYDVWAIEYGYTPFNATEEEAGLTKILSRSGDPKLAFGNDGDDMRAPGKAMDPRVNINDLTSDAIAYAEERFQLVNNLMSKLVTKYTKNGQSYAELRSRYNILNGQRNSMINAVSRYVGGVYIDRTFPEQKSGNKPYTPVSLATQKKAMEVMSKYVFAPNAFDADAQVYPYLQLQRRGFNQPANGEDYKVTNNVLALQVNGTLGHILSGPTLQRITNTRLYGNQYSAADMMSDLTKALFDADMAGNVNVYRQYLQSSFVNGLGRLIGETPGIDQVSRAACYYTARKLRTKLAAAAAVGNEETKAHRANMVFMLDKAMKTD